MEFGKGCTMAARMLIFYDFGLLFAGMLECHLESVK